MKSFCPLGVVLLLSVVELEAATSVSKFSCQKRNLSVTVDDELWLYIDGIEITGLQNAEDYGKPDLVDLPCTTKLIAVHGSNGPAGDVAGILASTDDNYILTNSSWKCSNVSQIGWVEIDFDDSTWIPALEYGHNEDDDDWVLVPGISSGAFWIWLRQYTSDNDPMDRDVFCRKRLELSYCLSSPCLFGATCVDESNGGYCICAPGYTGQTCSSVINYCDSSPCENGGSCESIVNGYICQCQPAYTGDNCQDEVNYCESSPCANGGSCVAIANGYACQCQPGYTGDNCEYEDPCKLSVGPSTDYTVSSTASSITGDPCTTIRYDTTTIYNATTTPPHGPCYPSPCRNEATCVDLGNTYNCTCVPGFIGQNCDVEINECETNPCYPFGKCTDLIGDYNCTCNPGYEANDTKTCSVTDLCANETQPCHNGGTCESQNALNRYYCLCPTIDDRQYVGLHCETVLVTRPTVNGGISPTSGIIAGGASVTIRGQGLDLFEPLGAYLIDISTTDTPKPTLYAYVIPNLTLSDSIIVRVPPADDDYIDLYCLIIVEYTGPINVTSEANNLRFKYTGNPVITTIEPTVILVSGGVHLTVSGSNMDIVQNPVMDITTIVVNKTTSLAETNNSRESCSVKNATAITCLIPQGIVPSSFINNTEFVGKSLPGVAHLESLFRHKRGRRTKRAPVANLTDDTGSTFEMYLGFIFDQYPTYNNISKSLPHVTLSFVPPQITFEGPIDCSIDFISNKQDTISLYGSGFTIGCSQQDYQVHISNATCSVTNLTMNELQCFPPKEEPPATKSKHCTSDPHPVSVIVGGEVYGACCLSYKTDYTDLIIGVAVICVIVVVIIILVAVLVYKRHRGNQKRGLPMMTYLRNKLASKGVTQKSMRRDSSAHINSEAPPEAVMQAARKANRCPANVRQPMEETDSRPVNWQPSAADDSGYLAPSDVEVALKRIRGNGDVNPGKQTTAVEIATESRYLRPASLTDDDDLKPRGGQLVSNNNDKGIDYISSKNRERTSDQDANRRPADKRHPMEERSPMAVNLQTTAADGYLVLYSDDATSKRVRSNVGPATPAKRTTTREIAPQRQHPTGTRPASRTKDDDLQPRDGQLVFNNNGGIDYISDNNRGRTRDQSAHIDDIGPERDPDYLPDEAAEVDYAKEATA